MHCSEKLRLRVRGSAGTPRSHECSAPDFRDPGLGRTGLAGAKLGRPRWSPTTRRSLPLPRQINGGPGDQVVTRKGDTERECSPKERRKEERERGKPLYPSPGERKREAERERDRRMSLKECLIWTEANSQSRVVAKRHCSLMSGIVTTITPQAAIPRKGVVL